MKALLFSLVSIASTLALGSNPVPDMILTMGSSFCVIFTNSTVEVYQKNLWQKKIYGPVPVSYEPNSWGGIHITSDDGQFDYRDLRPGSPTGNNEIVLNNEEGTMIFDRLKRSESCPFLK